MAFVIKNRTNVYTKQNFPLKAQKSLEYTGTIKDDWELAQVRQRSRREVNLRGVISFTGYENNQESTPFTDSLIEPLYNFKKANGCVHAYAKIDATGNIIPETNKLPEWAKSNCEFCGKLISEIHIIVCNEKELFLRIGSECRNQFTDAEDPLEQIDRTNLLTLRRLLLEDGWQSKMIDHISINLVYRKTTEQYGKFYPHKLYGDPKKLILALGYLQIPAEEDPKIIPYDLNGSSDERIIEIWKLAKKAFSVRNPTFLDAISDYLYRI